ncbi:MAG: pentapeptide repeat-containing protein [Solimicrobium sp.]|nr:pentapeptide repeat-containing protein [Solimicrobium sp.]
MLSLTRPLHNPNPTPKLNNLNLIEKDAVVELNVVNLKKRIEENRALLDSLKQNKKFQNILIFFLRCKEPDSIVRLTKFLVGKASLEECFSKERWIINLLARTCDEIEVRSGFFGPSHFLSSPLTDTLSIIFAYGYLESEEKFNSKMITFIESIQEDRLESLYLVGADLSWADLTGANLPWEDLTAANLRRANLNGANFEGSTLIRANLKQADLYNANLADSDLTEADLTQACMHRANLIRATLNRTILIGAKLNMAQLDSVYLESANLFQADLTRARLRFAKLCNANLGNANLNWAILRDADLCKANLSGANLTNAELNFACWDGAKFLGAKSTNPIILNMIKEQQRFEKYMLLSKITKEFTFEKSDFPKELRKKIGLDLI